MQRLKRAIKKMAAIGTGVAMLGATMTGAIAADLADYPDPFVSASGIFDASTAIVVGDAAAASDTLGAVDIATNLQFMAKTPVTAGAGTLQVSGGVTEDIPIQRGIANSTTYALDWHLDDGDIDSFMDTTVQFQGKDYDIHDELVLRKDTPSIETSLTSKDDNYETNVFMEIKKGAVYYYLMIDDGDLNISKATSSEPFEVKFLGKTLKITDAQIKVGGQVRTDRFTAYVGTEYFMDAGDTVTVEGKKVTLVNVGSNAAVLIDVDGTIDSIPASSTETVNGIEITNDETFYASAKSERAASLVIGKDAEATYKDQDPYIGEDESKPNWEWTIGELADEERTELNTSAPDMNQIKILPNRPFIGIYNDFSADDSEDAMLAGVGECYDLPNNYASVCFDSLTVSDDDYLELTIEIDKVDLADTGVVDVTSNEQVIKISTDIEHTLKIPTSATGNWKTTNGTLADSDVETNEIYIAINGTDNFYDVFYYDSDHTPNRERWLGSIGCPQHHPRYETVAQINWGDTKNNNVNITAYNMSGIRLPLMLNTIGDSTSELNEGADDLLMYFINDSNGFSALGNTSGEEELLELKWKTTTDPGNISLGKKDEDHRTPYGIIIKDPSSNSADDTVIVEIPGDQVQANVVVKGQAATVAGGATSYIPADITIDTKLSSEVAGAETAHQLILVGGPCANPTVEAVSSLGTTCSGWTMGAGEAVLKMAANGNKVALLIAGTDAVDTRMAAKVVANYEDYDLSGSSVVVTGSMSSPILKVA